MASPDRGFVKQSRMPGDHVYDGITFPAFYHAANFDAMNTWQVRPDDVFCVTFPKSGTHWIYEIVSLIMNGGDPSKIERSHMIVLPELSADKNADIKSVNDTDAIAKWPAGYKEIDRWESPRVIQTHLHERMFPIDGWKKKVKIIYLARNPKDVICSTAAFALPIYPPEMQDFDYFVKCCLQPNHVRMGTWFEHVLEYSKHQDDDNFLFLKYEDLHKDLVGKVKEIAAFLERPLTEEVAKKIALHSTMEQMKKSYDKHEQEDPQGIKHTRVMGKLKFLNKGKVGNWKDKITGDLNDLFDKVYIERMAGSELKFDFEI